MHAPKRANQTDKPETCYSPHSSRAAPNDEWTEACRYIGPETLAACQKAAQKPGTNAETGVTIEPLVLK
jgi:hypothetical protein